MYSDEEILRLVTVDKADATVKKYTSMLRKIVELTGNKTVMMAVNKPTATHRCLAARYTNARSLEGYLSLINVVCGVATSVISAAVRGKWKRFFEEVGDTVVKAAENNVVSGRLEEKWIEYSEIAVKCELLADTLMRGPGGSMREWQALVLLAFYAHLPPKRADLGAVRIIETKGLTSAIGECDEGNACVLTSNGGALVLNEYKTFKTYKKFVEKLPAALFDIVTASLRAHPRDYLLCGLNNKRPLSVQSMSNRVVRVMGEYVGKELSINDLRHIYITQTVSFDRMTIAQRGVIAKSMMHSADVQLQYARVIPLLEK